MQNDSLRVISVKRDSDLQSAGWYCVFNLWLRVGTAESLLPHMSFHLLIGHLENHHQYFTEIDPRKHTN